jgi:hypothetical protein
MDKFKEDSNKEPQQETRESGHITPEITKELILELKKVEPVLELYSKVHYWFSAIIVGTFIWFIGSFDKFIVNHYLPLKWLFILCSIALGIAVILIGIITLMYLKLRLSLDKFYIDTRFIVKELTKEENKTAMTRLRSSMEELERVEPALKYAYIFYGIGVLLISIYIFVFITYYI